MAATLKLLPYVKVLIGNEEDFIKVLGMKIEGVGEDFKGLEVDSYKKMVEQVVKAHPQVEAVGTTLREVVSGLVNHWSAILWHEGKFHQSRKYENLEIEDRVGGGDGFAAGVVYGLLAGNGPQGAVEYGAAHGALASTTPGDTSMATRKEVEKQISGGGARVVR